MTKLEQAKAISIMLNIYDEEARISRLPTNTLTKILESLVDTATAVNKSKQSEQKMASELKISRDRIRSLEKELRKLQKKESK